MGGRGGKVGTEGMRNCAVVSCKFSLKTLYLTVTLSRKFAIKRSLQIPPHLNGVATLPYEIGPINEILMSENIAYPMLWHSFLKYKS